MAQAPRTKRERVRADLELLARTFPAIRGPDDDRGRFPLKIGIHEDILTAKVPDPDTGGPLSRRRVDQALRAYVGDIRYHAAVAKMSRRFGLDARPCGDIDVAAKAHALGVVRRWAKRLARRPAPRQRAEAHA